MSDLPFRLLVCTSQIVREGAICIGLMVVFGWQVGVVAQPITSQNPGQSFSQVELDKGFALAKGKTCLGCHQIDAKRVGPAFQQIAQRHADTPGNLDYLAGAIRQGGRGRWGAVPMPAQTQVSESESRLLAQWILSLKP